LAQQELQMPEAREIKVGEVVNDFTLPDSAETPRLLSELASRGHSLLVFYRGHW
jgi:peroxiredoxin